MATCETVSPCCACVSRFWAAVTCDCETCTSCCCDWNWAIWASVLDSSWFGSSFTSGWATVALSASLTEISSIRACPSLVRFINCIGRTSPEAVTVERSSGLTSSLTVVTSGVSVRLANTAPMMIKASSKTTDTMIMIFFFRLRAISIFLGFQGNYLLLLILTDAIDPVNALKSRYEQVLPIVSRNMERGHLCPQSLSQDKLTSLTKRAIDIKAASAAALPLRAGCPRSISPGQFVHPLSFPGIGDIHYSRKLEPHQRKGMLGFDIGALDLQRVNAGTDDLGIGHKAQVETLLDQVGGRF